MLRARSDGCAVLITDHFGRPVLTCSAPPAQRARWRYESGDTPILLCERHAQELAGHERLTCDNAD